MSDLLICVLTIMATAILYLIIRLCIIVAHMERDRRDGVTDAAREREEVQR